MTENPLLVSMTQKQVEMMHLLDDRRHLLRMARESRDVDDLDGFLGAVLSILERIQVCDERYVELHRHCLSMLEQGGKILELDAMRRPVVVSLSSDEKGEGT